MCTFKIAAAPRRPLLYEEKEVHRVSATRITISQIYRHLGIKTPAGFDILGARVKYIDKEREIVRKRGGGRK